ncbi:MAG: V-type ATP synthase subunit B, partial [Clostridiales bacterium]|nr:V-type ATP synthase subunit B [Clostridiales bacterium]
FDENRSIEETLELGWDLLCLLPKSEIDRVDEKLLDEKYDTKRAESFRNIE